MFIEPRSDTSLKLRRSVRLLPLSDLLRSYGTKPCARNVSYKHLAALRPVQTGSQGRTTHYYPRTPGFVSPLALTAALASVDCYFTWGTAGACAAVVQSKEGRGALLV
jgi:hypothetical protein